MRPGHVALRTIPQTIAAAACLYLIAVPASAQSPLTGAERSAFERTSSHEEVRSFLDEVSALSDKILIEDVAVTNEGRVMPMAILGNPPSATPGTAWLSGKPTVFFTGSVHGNERAGKEGSQQLIRELTLGELQPLLDRVNVLIIPSMNPDGAERPGRTNSLGYDMNRDFIVAETPEVTAIVETLTTWWPDVYVDVHNGGAYPYNVTYQATLHPAADADLVAFARGPMYDGISEHLGTHDMITYWYSGPRRTPDGGWAWGTTPPWARKQHSYGGLQNVITLLFEIPGRWTLEEQADNAREGMEGMLRFVADNPEAVRETVMGARHRTIVDPPDEIPIEVEEAAYPELEEFYVMPDRDGEPELVTGENRTLFVPTESRSWPYAYAFDGRFDEVAALLRRHAVEVEQLTDAATVTVQRYVATSVAWAESPYQNHLLADVDAELTAAESVELPAGTYLVRTRQNAGRLLTHVLEPDTEDSLFTWNFFDHSMPGPQAVSAGEGYLPILRVTGATPLKTRVTR